MRATLRVALLTGVLWHLGCAWVAQAQPACGDTFAEAVEVAPLSDQHVLVSVRLHQRTWLGCSATTFPQAIRRLVASAPLSDLHLTLTRGRWDYRHWGLPAVPVHAYGAEVAVRWAEPGHHIAHWTRLMHRLSGLMCASLTLLADPHSAPPDPMLSAALDQDRDTTRSPAISTPFPHYHVGHLPRESVCTENLSPWLSLCPCGGRAGLTTLLQNRTHVLGGAYHSISLHVSVERGVGHGTSSTPPVVHLTQRFTAALRVAHDASEPVTVSRVFAISDEPPVPACPAASASDLTVWQHRSDTPSPAPPQATPEITSLCGDPHTVTLLQNLDHTLRHEALSLAPVPPAVRATPRTCLLPALSLDVALLGTGLYTGQLQVVITQEHPGRVGPASTWPADLLHATPLHTAGRPGARNTHPPANTVGAAACVHMTVPWVLRLWWHTLRISVDGQEAAPPSLGFTMSLVPARDRGRPALVTLCTSDLPRQARQVMFHVSLTRAFLTLEEHPPDAHRGWDVTPDRLLYHDTAPQCRDDSVTRQCTASVQEVLGPGLLVQLPTADVAMPYNVICLTSTVLAVFLGATLNTLIRRTSKPGMPAAER